MIRRALAVVVVALVSLLVDRGMVEAHSGPPFPILSNRVAGPYSISIWTDPDTTDDGRAAGRFWIVIDATDSGTSIPQGTAASVNIHPVDRPGPERSGQAVPMNGLVSRQFVALLMDHEGPFAVRATVTGPLGRAEVESQVDATYDLRPAPGMIAVYLFPFVAVGALWVKVLRRRRRGASRS